MGRHWSSQLRSLPLVLLVVMSLASARGEDAPRILLRLPDGTTDPAAIDYERLPTLAVDHAVVQRAALGPGGAPPDLVDMHHLRLNLHNYLAYHDGRFWCIWSDGPKVEDEPTQEVKYSTSVDGRVWSAARSVTGTPPAPEAYIARGLWVRDGELLALAAHFEGKGAFGDQAQKRLRLEAFGWDQDRSAWTPRGLLYDNAINNFAPQRLGSGDWLLTRRDSRFNVSILIGGKTALDDWREQRLVGIDQLPGFRPDEPIVWQQADGELRALFRDNGGSSRLFEASSRDEGRSWNGPAITNFPNSSSKLFSLATSHGERVLVLNAHPAAGRRELHLATSPDGLVFTRLYRLDIPSPPANPPEIARLSRKFSSGIASLQYPHAIEHEGRLWIAFSRGKVQTEVVSLPLESLRSH